MDELKAADLQKAKDDLQKAITTAIDAVKVEFAPVLKSLETLAALDERLKKIETLGEAITKLETTVAGIQKGVTAMESGESLAVRMADRIHKNEEVTASVTTLADRLTNVEAFGARITAAEAYAARLDAVEAAVKSLNEAPVGTGQPFVAKAGGLELFKRDGTPVTMPEDRSSSGGL